MPWVEVWASSGNSGSCPGCAGVLDADAASESDESIQFTWIMDQTLYPKVFTLNDPRRLVVDMEPAWTSGLPRLLSWTHPLLRGSIRMAWHPDERRLRFVLDLHPGIRYDVTQDLYLSRQPGEPVRFVLRVSRVPAK